LLKDKFEIMIIGVASQGLEKEWLGKVIDEKELVKLKKASKKHLFHIGFEGGEAETFVLDCPLFKRKLELVKGKVHWNEIQSGQRILRRHHFLKLKKYHRARFALETILNQQAILHQWKTQVFYPPQPLIPITPSKLKKHGLLKGLAEEVRMCREIILFTSLSDHIRQCQYILHPPKLPR